MKKKVLLIGNDDGLAGVKVDIRNYERFFKSPEGGSWTDAEIIIKINPSLSSLRIQLALLKLEELDYLVIVFSGHGGQKRETILELNAKEETIGESALKNIAVRQLTIFDCCRCYPEYATESRTVEMFAKAMSKVNTRERFESRIMKAMPQQVSLYSCSIGEVSNDTSEGGVYSKNLILAAKDFNSEFKLVGSAHQNASEKVREYNKTVPLNERQHPEAVLPKCFSSQQLILGIRP